MTLIFPNKNHFLFNIENTNTLLKLSYGDRFKNLVDDQIEEKSESYQAKRIPNFSFFATLQIEDLSDFAGRAFLQKRKARKVLIVSRRTCLQQNAICSAKLKAPLLQSILVLPPIFIDSPISKASTSSNKSKNRRLALLTSTSKNRRLVCKVKQISLPRYATSTNRRFVRRFVRLCITEGFAFTNRRFVRITGGFDKSDANQIEDLYLKRSEVKRFVSKAKLCKNQDKTIKNTSWIKKPILLSQKSNETEKLNFNKLERYKQGKDLKKKVPIFLSEEKEKASAKYSEQKIQKGSDSIVTLFIGNNINLLKKRFYSIKQFVPKLRIWGFAVGSSFFLIGITSILQRQEQNRWFFTFSRSALPGFYLTSEESSWECFENITFKHLSRKYLSQCNSRPKNIVKKIDCYKDIWYLGFSELWNQQAIQNYTAVFSKYCNPLLSEGSLFYKTKETGQVKNQTLVAKPLQIEDLDEGQAKQKQLSLKDKWLVQPLYQIYARVSPKKEMFKLKINNYKERIFFENDSIPSKMSSSATSSYKLDTFSPNVTFVKKAPLSKKVIYPFIKKKVSDGAGVTNILLREQGFCEDKTDILSLNEIKLYNSIRKGTPKNYIDSANDIIKNLFYKSDNFCVQPKAFSPTSKNIAFLPLPEVSPKADKSSYLATLQIEDLSDFASPEVSPKSYKSSICKQSKSSICTCKQSVSFKNMLERSPKATVSQDIFLLKKQKSYRPSRESSNVFLSKDAFEKAIFRDRFSFLQKENFFKLPPPAFRDRFSSRVAPFFCKVSFESSLATSKSHSIPFGQSEDLLGVAFAPAPLTEINAKALLPHTLKSRNGYTHFKASRLKMGEKISSYFLFKRKTISNRLMSGYKKPETKNFIIKGDKEKSICYNGTGVAFASIPEGERKLEALLPQKPSFLKPLFAFVEKKAKVWLPQKPNPLAFWSVKSRSFKPWIEFSIKVPPALPFYQSKIKALSYTFNPVFKEVFVEPIEAKVNQGSKEPGFLNQNPSPLVTGLGFCGSKASNFLSPSYKYKSSICKKICTIVAKANQGSKEPGFLNQNPSPLVTGLGFLNQKIKTDKKEKDVSEMKSVAALKKMPYRELSLNEKGEVEPLFEQVNKTFYFSPYRFVFKKSLFTNYNDYLSWPKDNPIAISITPFIDRSIDDEEKEIKEQEISPSSELQKKRSKKKERFEKPMGSENKLLTFDENVQESDSQLRTAVESSSYNSPVGTTDNFALESSNVGEEEEKKREITKSEWLEQIRESEQSLEKRKDLQKLAYPKKKALAYSYLQRSSGKIQNLLVSDRKASFFGITNLFPKRLISEDQKQIASQVLRDDTNISLLESLSTQKHDARRDKRLCLQEKSFGVKLEEQVQDQLQKVGKDQRNLSKSKTSYKSSICTCKPLSFKKTTTKFITKQHPIYTPNKRLRLRVPQPSQASQNSNNQARLDDLNLSSSHRWWQKRRISSSLLGAPSKRYLVMPAITTQDWRKIIEWQLKIYFLEEEKRLLQVQKGALETGVLSKPNFSFSFPGFSHDARLCINSGFANGDTKQVQIKNLLENLYDRNESSENVLRSKASFVEQYSDANTLPLATKRKEEISLEKNELQEEAFSKTNEQSFFTQTPETKQLFTIKKLAIYLPWTSLKKSLKKPFEWPVTLLSYSSLLQPQKSGLFGDNNQTLDIKNQGSKEPGFLNQNPSRTNLLTSTNRRFVRRFVLVKVTGLDFLNQFSHIEKNSYGSISYKSPIYKQSSSKRDKNPMQSFIRNKKPDSCFVSSISPPFKTVSFKVRKNQVESNKTLKLRKSNLDTASENISKLFLFEAQTQNSYLLLHTLFLAIAIKKLFKGLYNIFGTLILSKIKNSSLSVLLLPFFVNAFGSSNRVYSFNSLKTRAKHLAGSEDTISSLSEIVWYLRNSCRGRLIPRGVVLVEKASSESTHFLKAIGGEAQVPVIVQSLRALPYTQNHPQRQLEKILTFAQKRAPCILFLDDLDSIGQSRTLLLKNNLDKPFSMATKKIEPSFLGSFNSCNASLKSDYSSNSFLDKGNFTKEFSNSRLPIENLYARVSTDSDKSSYKSKICRPNNNQGSKEPGFLNQNPSRTNLRFVKVTGLGFSNQVTTTLESFTEREQTKISPFVGLLETEKIVEQRRVDLMLRLLTVMDGISGLNGVLIVTTSKNPSKLDPALLRPGRFEKLIHLKLPTKKKRISLLKRECARLGHTNLMPWEYFGRQTQDMTGTDIASAVNHSAFRAIIQSTVHSFPTLEYGINRVAKSCKAPGCKTIGTEDKSTRSREISSQISFYKAGKKILRALILNNSGSSFSKTCSKMQKIKKENDSVSRYCKRSHKNYLIKTDYVKEGICLYAGQAALALYFDSISCFNNKGFKKPNPVTFTSTNLLTNLRFVLVRRFVRDGFWFSKPGFLEPWFTNTFLCTKKRLLALQSTFSFNEGLNASSIIKEMTTHFCFYPKTKENLFKIIGNQKFVSLFTNETFISSDRSFLHNKNSTEPSAILDINFSYYNMVLTCFYVAFQNCTENRELLDFVTDHLIRFKVLKVHEILRIFLFYY